MNKVLGLAAYLVKKIWFLLAILLVLFAVLLSAMRYALPHLEHKKHLLEDYVHTQYGVELSIDNIHAVWKKNGPSIVLNGLELAQNDSSPVSMSIEQVYVEVDFWQSLSQVMLSSQRFDLIGLRLDIDITRLSDQSNDSQFPVVDALESLFLEQLQRFSLAHGEIALHKESDTQVFELEGLQWSNMGSRHQGLGRIRVKELASNSADFILDLHGEGKSLDGLFYAKGQALDVSPWVSGLLATSLPLVESRTNLEVWIGFEDSQFNGLQARFDDSYLQWGNTESEQLQTHIRSGQFEAFPVENDWAFRVDQLVLEANKSSVVTDFVGKVTAAGDVLVNTVKPLPIAPFVAFVPLFSESLSPSDILSLQPSGELATLQLELLNGQPSVAAKVIDISWQQQGLTPGIENVDLDIYWNQNQGAVKFTAKDSKLDIDGLLGGDLVLDELGAEVYLFNDESAGWTLLSKNINVNTNLVDLNQSLRYEFSSKNLSLITDIDPFAAEHVSKLLPGPLMGKNTTAYLKRALIGPGKIDSARLILQGNPSLFPFKNNEGLFHAQVNVSDAEFLFSSRWPSLKKLNLTLDFVNDDLFMASPSATLDGVQVSKMHANIMTLSHAQNVVIDAYGKTTGDELTALILKSNLAHSLGEVLENGVNVDGEVASTLNLRIPLRGGDVVAQGTASLLSNHVIVPSIDMEFTEARGSVSFVNEQITASSLSAKLFNQDISLDLFGQQTPDAYDLAIKMQGDWLAQPLLDRFNAGYATYINGHSQWQADIGVLLQKSDFTYHAELVSELIGIESLLPAPFSKSAPHAMTFAVTSSGNKQASSIQAKLGSEVRFDGVLPHQEMQFSRAHLAAGDTDFVGLGVGFSVSAALDVMYVEDWYKAIELLISGFDGSKGKPIFGVPERIFIDAENLVVFEQTLNDVSIAAKQSNNNWMLDINSHQTRATVSLYDQWLERGIEIEADYVLFNNWNEMEQSVEHEWDHATLPPIYFHCGQCTLFEKKLGEVTLDVAKSPEGMNIRRLEAKSEYGHLTASGKWSKNANVHHSELTGTVTSDDFGRLLSNFGLESGIKDSEATIAFSFDWDDSPMDFSFENLDGNVDWSLTDGYLSELSDQGSRIFTLFSLNSLVRKLSLDFRDVFAKGFFYDGMKGTMQVKEGLATTDDTVVDGGAGEIEIHGHTNMVDKTMDYNVSFAPNVTGNLPFLVYFAVNPPTAIAALAIDQVLSSAKVISNVNYRVIGPLDSPQFIEVGRDSKDVALPAKQNTPPKQNIDTPITESDLEPIDAEIING